MYADDTQLYLSIEPANISVLINNLEKCISDVKDWMFDNKLKLNDDKTESVLCNPRSYDVSTDKINIGDESACFINVAKNLGVMLDEDLNMNQHISHLSRAVYLEIRRLRHMSNFANRVIFELFSIVFDFCHV